MKAFKKLLSAVTASAVTLSLAAGTTAMFSTVSAADIDSMTAVELVEDMGTGWNLGNSFDCTNTWDNPLTVDKIETAWGNPKTTEGLIDFIAFHGFKTIRIPVTWYQMTSSDGTINTEYLARIKEVVDWCYANDLYVIINMHHDGLSGNWLANGTGAKDQFSFMWTQIASYFKGYDRHLAFEAWNEIDWDYNTIQTMGQAFVDAVRNSSGDYNDDRLLIIPGKNTNFDATVSTSYQLPTDPANMLAVDIHYYDPTQYTVYSDDDNPWGGGVTPQNTWGTDAEIAEVKNDFLQLSSRFVDNGIPVIIGEYGVENLNKPDDQGRVVFTETVASEAYNANGICAILWDGSEGSDMQYTVRANQTWLNSEFGEFYKELSGGTYVSPDGMILTDRVTVTGTFTDAEDATALIVDLKQFQDTAAVLKDVIWTVIPEGLTDAGYYGQVAVQANMTDLATRGEHNWAYQPVSIANESDVYTTSLQEGWNYNDADGKAALYDMTQYTLEYDYLKLAFWYVGSDGTAPTMSFDPEVTIIFEEPIWVTPNYEVPTEPESTEPSSEETTEPSSEDTTAAPTEDTTAPTETDSDPAGASMCGDVNNDGTINIADVILLNRALLGDAEIDAVGKANADTDGNSILEATDSLNILKLIVELIDALPV